MVTHRCSIIFFIILLCLSSCSQQTAEDNVGSGSAYIENKGSDTMVNLALAWAEAYQNENANARISVTGGGTGTGIAALINGTVDIANASRQIKSEEMAQAQKNGQIPVEMIVAKDAIAVIVHRENPVDHLTIQQISEIYSGKINNWQEVGGEDRVVVRLSRETNSGTHVYFLEEVLRFTDETKEALFSQDTLLLPSSEGITKEISYNLNAIGYDGLGYVTDEVKVIGVARDENGPFVLPSTETVNDGSYPIARDLYMYTVNEPAGAVRAYIDWIFSSQAQEIVNQLGFVSILDTHE
jgi:phosphate transport system substrate-binding protein